MQDENIKLFLKINSKKMKKFKKKKGKRVILLLSLRLGLLCCRTNFEVFKNFLDVI